MGAADKLGGFDAKPYPVVPAPGSDEDPPDATLYVCQTCKPQWDTFDEAQAKAHAEAGRHLPEATTVELGLILAKGDR